MTCPDEDTVAQLLQGLLPDEERARLEQHIDGCPACTELLAELGRAYERTVEPRPADLEPPPLPSTLIRIELFAAVIHALVTAKLAWLFIAEVAPAPSWLSNPASMAGVIGYAALSGPIGIGAALLSAWALSRRRNWADRAAMVHAVLALPSVLLTPLGAYILVRYRHGARIED